VTTMAEVEWDEASRDMVLGMVGYADTLCSLCGRPAHVCQDPANQFNWYTPPPTRCHATTAVLAQQQGFTEETNPQVNALLFGAELRKGTP
jgi:hypothetical protein